MRGATGLALGMAVSIAAGGAGAEPVDGATATGLLFATTGVEATVYKLDWITDADRQVLGQVVATQKYYGAIAASPDEGLLAEPTVVAANFHDIAAARAGALRDCNAKRKDGSAECALVMEFRPKGWEQRPLQLNADATAAMAGDYAKADAPKALAASASTGEWALKTGEGAAEAAVADCAAKAKADDCRVVVAD